MRVLQTINTDINRVTKLNPNFVTSSFSYLTLGDYKPNAYALLMYSTYNSADCGRPALRQTKYSYSIKYLTLIVNLFKSGSFPRNFQLL